MYDLRVTLTECRNPCISASLINFEMTSSRSRRASRATSFSACLCDFFTYLILYANVQFNESQRALKNTINSLRCLLPYSQTRVHPYDGQRRICCHLVANWVRARRAFRRFPIQEEKVQHNSPKLGNSNFHQPFFNYSSLIYSCDATQRPLPAIFVLPTATWHWCQWCATSAAHPRPRLCIHTAAHRLPISQFIYFVFISLFSSSSSFPAGCPY
ncbi:hypothetical protein BDR04DRAFT_512514 [Suillus decipiens]|nr:hypothetical protein BDR04DRAFT_512514 [Suillus decipiens]